MSQRTDAAVVERASEALHRHAWQEAFDLLSEADGRAELTPDGLELLADAAWWIGKLPIAIDAREREYAAATKAGQTDAAVRAAVSLARDNLFRNANGVANGWLKRAERLLEGSPESPANGYLAATRAFHAARVGDLDEALASATIGYDIGVRYGDRDLQALALSERGATLVAKGDVKAGLAEIDEATVAAVGGELDAATAGGVCCTSIEACTSLGDLRRAADWTDAQDRWCSREGISGYPGMCRLFRSEIKRLRGAWLEAESEARRASTELEGFIPAAVGMAMYQIGEIRLRRGDLPAAEAALVQAQAHGEDPQPALALLRLAEGNVAAAAAVIRQALDEPAQLPSWRAPPNSGLHRLPLLAADVEIALAAGDVEVARSAVDELRSIATTFDVALVRATAATCEGAVLAAEGDPDGAARRLREGLAAWLELDAPYEAARARLLLAETYLAAGHGDRAEPELEIARATFERLGATPDMRIADSRLAGLRAGRGPRAAPATGNRVLRTLMFTDIVDSTRLSELLGDDAWNDLIRWHDETLRAIVVENGGVEVKSTGDGLFAAFEAVDAAIDAAIAIQRRLTAQRKSQGFAPGVRIGLHRAEVTQAGLDFHGGGVNLAARIGAAASGDEIVVSTTTLEAAGRAHAEIGRRTVDLKGISTPVDIATIDWR